MNTIQFPDSTSDPKAFDFVTRKGESLNVNVTNALNNGVTLASTPRFVLANRTESLLGSIGTTADLPVTSGQRIKTLTFTNNTGSVVFLQIHNKSSALATSDVPLNGLVFRIPANSTLDKTVADFGEAGVLYGPNIRIGLSSTFATYTAITPTNTSINVITVQ